MKKVVKIKFFSDGLKKNSSKKADDEERKCEKNLCLGSKKV